MGALADVARFAGEDCDELVLASLACGLCLGSDEVDWELDGDGYDATASCHCRRCDVSWPVYLTAIQALRLSLLRMRAR